MDLLDLARHLRQEKLFVTAEQGQIQKLFEEVKKVAEDLFHETWIVRQQRICLESLILTSQNYTPKEGYGKTNLLEQTTFVDAYRQLNYHESKYGELMKFLRDNPYIVAAVVDLAEKLSDDTIRNFLVLVISAVYGNVVLQEDEVLLAQMVKGLADYQLGASDDPRRLLRKGSCAFSVAFKQMFDSLHSAKLFLTAALHEPVMRLLMEDEWFYDIDPQKALHRFPPQERNRRFGEPTSENYNTKCQDYRKFIVDKLVGLSNRFIVSIKNNMHCFPSSLAWLVSQVYQLLTKSKKHDASSVRAICADLVFSLFVCPAIIDPDSYGITSDIHISHIARHNLMQIAQIIQVLGLSQWSEESREKDLYDKFEKGCISSLLDVILDTAVTNVPAFPGQSHMINLGRSSVLVTTSQLHFLVSILRQVLPSLDEGVQERKQLEELLSGIPSMLITRNNSSHSLTSALNQSTSSTGTPPGTPIERRKTKGKKKQNTPDDASSVTPSESDSSVSSQTADEVLVIPLGVDVECPGMMSEAKVLSWEQENKRRHVKHVVPGYDDGVGNPVFQEKRTRFSLSQDQESIDLSLTGNTSDIQEAISEAASSHSVGSVDLENDVDNEDTFSDMISANVSGRGTPNISGRDTPLSQAGSVEEAPPPQLPEIPPLPETIKKTNREDVTERFGKFEIKTELERDETKSTVSDTWSTDVLASDSEPPEANQYDRLEEVVRQSLLARQDHVSEVSETASDAWSTDVLASDTDDKQALSEFDLDDIGSVTDLASMSGDILHPEIAEGNEETPLASGHQSPLEEPVPENLGAMGGDPASGGGNDASVPSVFTDNLQHRFKSPRKPVRHSTPTDMSLESADDFLLHSRNSDIHADSNRLSIPSKQRPHSARGSSGRVGNLLSVPEHNSSQKLTNQQQQGTNQTFLSDRILHPIQADKPAVTQGERPPPPQPLLLQPEKVGQPENSEVVKPQMSFHPLQPEKITQPLQQPKPASQNQQSASHDLFSAFDLQMKSTMDLPASSPKQPLQQFPQQQDTFVAFENPGYVGGAKPKMRASCPTIGSQRKQTSSEAEQGNQSKAKSLIEWTVSSSTDSGFEGTPQSTESQSLDSLVDQTTSLKISEQQNTNFHTSRLSMTLSMFDPISTDPEGNVSDMAKMESDGQDGAWVDPLMQMSSDNGKRGSDKILRPIPKKANEHDLIANGGLNGDLSATDRARNDSFTSSTSTGSDGVPFAKSSRSASLDNISDRSAEKEFPEVDNDEREKDNKKKGFFSVRSLKDRFNRGSRRPKSGIFQTHATHGSRSRRRRGMKKKDQGSLDSGEVSPSVAGVQRSDSNKEETSEDILAKYRKAPVGVRSSSSSGDTGAVAAGSSADVLTTKEKRQSFKDEEIDGPPLYDPNNLETCFAFTDAKRKLRIVLSNADIHLGYNLSDFCFPVANLGVRDLPQDSGKDSNSILRVLRGQLAEAINLQNKDIIAQLHEAIRCVRLFDLNGCKKLLFSLQEDYKCRSAYISYLIRCRQGLLLTQSYLQRLLDRVARDKQVCSNHMTSVCVQMFIDKKEGNVIRFITDFQKLTMADEKTDLLERFLQFLHQSMMTDIIWQACTENQIEDAQLAIERFIMSRIYTHAMFPNGDGDILRDQVFQQNIKKLSQNITPSHKDLKIPRIYQFECPWTAAQKELFMINAYKTPRDKVKCVTRCSTTIMNLLSMANEKSVPAADDFIPVLIYVVIKANPPCMLSTVQYVNSFYEQRLGGEEQYWWTQFVAALEFIKTMV